MSKKNTPAKAAGEEPLSGDGPLTERAARLAFAAPAATPSPKVKEQLMARIRAAKSVQPSGWRFESASAAEGWRQSAFPGVRFKTLSVDETRDRVTVLIEMAAGARFPDHAHDSPEEGIVLSGDVVSGGRLMKTGDYYHAEPGTTHQDNVSPSGCTALVSLSAKSWKIWRALSPA